MKTKISLQWLFYRELFSVVTKFIWDVSDLKRLGFDESPFCHTKLLSLFRSRTEARVHKHQNWETFSNKNFKNCESRGRASATEHF